MNGSRIKLNIEVSQQIVGLIEQHNPTYVVLDCDGTLYPNIWEARRSFYESLYNFLFKKFGYSKDNTNAFIKEQKEKYATVSEIAACLLSGINEAEFNEGVIKPMKLESLGIEVSSLWCELIKYKIPLIVFTNNSSFFASLIASKVGIIDNVERIFGESELNFVRKPAEQAFRLVIDSLPKDAKILFFDDDVSCVKMGESVGWISVLTLYGEKYVADLSNVRTLIIN